MSFGKVLKELRKKANMTQEQLAQQLAISPQAISRWETDFAMPDISLIVPIAEIFDVSTDCLLGKNNDYDEMAWQKETREGLRNFVRGLSLVDTLQACEMAEKILNLVFENGNFLDFHFDMYLNYQIKSRLLREEERYKESVDALRKAQFHTKELDKVKLFEKYTYTNKLFRGLICKRERGDTCELYTFNTFIVNLYEKYFSHEDEYLKKLVEEIKNEGSYYKNNEIAMSCI